MLDEQLAKKFIDKIASYTSHNVNIINEKGIIVAASKNPQRVGNFHEVAYNMMQKDTPVSKLSEADTYLGVQPGVNMVLTCKGKKMGVVGITGNPDEIYDIALIIKMSLETMIEYETQYELIQERKNTKLHFINTLLYTDDEEVLKELTPMAEALEYKPDILRIPLLISADKNLDMSLLMDILKNSPGHSSQDIMALTKNRHIILFKSFSEGAQELFQVYRSLLEEYLQPLIQFSKTNHLNCRICAGSFQDQIQDCHHGYRHCVWMMQNHPQGAVEISYFYDYVNEYMTSQVPFIEIHKVYGVFSDILPEDFQKNLMQTISSLEHNNYNLNTSSKELYIHKNTLIFRFNKIKSFFGINPVQVTSDRNFLSYLNYYLNNK